MYRTSAYPHLLRKFSDDDTTVLQSLHLVNELVISAFWGSTGTSVALHRRAAIFESVVPLLNLCDAHGIVAENPLNLPNGFHLAMAKLLQNLMQYCCSSRSIIFAENNNATRAAYTLSFTRWLHATDAVCWREKTHVCAWKYPPPP